MYYKEQIVQCKSNYNLILLGSKGNITVFIDFLVLIVNFMLIKT